MNMCRPDREETRVGRGQGDAVDVVTTKTTSIRLDAELHRQLKDIARICGTSISQEIVLAVKAHVRKRPKERDFTDEFTGLVERNQDGLLSRVGARPTKGTG